MAQIVLSDATALIYLAQIPDGLSLLDTLFGQVTITSVVKEEVLPQKSAPGEREIERAISKGLIAVVEDRWPEPAFPWLDTGEASTLRAAINLANSGNECLVIIDEKNGRGTAKELSSPVIIVTGTAAVIGRAKELGLIPSATAVFQQLREKGFRISDEVIREVLRNIREPIKPPFTKIRKAISRRPRGGKTKPR